MNYKLHYDNLIFTRIKLKQERIIDKKVNKTYYESHHILPKSMGGKGYTYSYNHSNIVILTPKEHFIAHYLLYKIYQNKQMIYSFWLFCNNSAKNRKLVISSRTYDYAKRLFNSISPMLNKKHSSNSKDKISNSVYLSWNTPEGLLRKQKRDTCINCGLISNPSNIKRHLKKCKNPSNSFF